MAECEVRSEVSAVDFLSICDDAACVPSNLLSHWFSDVSIRGIAHIVVHLLVLSIVLSPRFDDYRFAEASGYLMGEYLCPVMVSSLALAEWASLTF